jgi:hypothetical protein
MFVTISIMIQSLPSYPPPTTKADVGLRKLSVARPGDAGDRTTPKFARHRAHVRAVLAQGGFPVLARP